MCCALRHLPVTDFLSDHPFSSMTDRGPSPHRRRDDTYPLRTALPSRDPAKDDHRSPPESSILSQARERQIEPSTRTTPSPAHEQPTAGSISPSAERMRHITPRAVSTEPNRNQAQSHPQISSAQSEAIPTGQVCRYVQRARGARA
jgi:hypothetical protein